MQREVFQQRNVNITDEENQIGIKMVLENGRTTTLNMWCNENPMPGTGKIRKLAGYFRPQTITIYTAAYIKAAVYTSALHPAMPEAC